MSCIYLYVTSGDVRAAAGMGGRLECEKSRHGKQDRAGRGVREVGPGGLVYDPVLLSRWGGNGV